jgi:tetratricopeptide (TPR) repeat protein
MSDENLNIDAPVRPETEQPTEPVRRRPRRWPFVIIGILILIVGGGVGGWLGYQQAVDERVQKASAEVSVAAATQFELALVDFAEGRLSNARKRLEYVIQINPVFPGAQEKLAEVMAAEMLALTPTITPSPTPTPVTPTPDMRGVEAQYNTILDLMRAQEWNTAIDAIEALRQADLSYRAVDVDGLYYICLRYRGLRKILVEGNLEGGTYDLALSARFGPLDRDADSYRIWARMYITGASFWKVNWEKVIEYFIQVAPAFPNMRDGSGMTANERLRQAYFEYGKKLILEERSCEAVSMFESSLALGNSEEVSNYYNQAVEACGSSEEGGSEEGGESQSTLTPTPTVTPTPGLTEIPTEIITETPIPTEETLVPTP